MDENSTPDDSIYINPADGLSNDHPALPADSDSDADNRDASSDADPDDNDDDDDTFDDLPTSLIVTNIHADVFTDGALRADMEQLFQLFGADCKFQWLRSFRRLRVIYTTGLAAANARIQLHQYPFGKSVITCYFAQPVTPVARRYLKPPAPFKQFLISPPASPPAGWEPREEGEPLVNHDLLAALANLTPGESHELHRPGQPEHPAIVVHTALLPTMPAPPELDGGDIHEDEEDVDGGVVSMKARIPQTKCPERAASS